MYLESRTEQSVFTFQSKGGKKFERRAKPKTTHILQCDKCECRFERQGHALAPDRRNNNYKHFCDGCCDPAMFADLGRETYRKNLADRIGEKGVDSLGYATTYVGDTHPYSEGYCGSIRDHIMVMENHLERALKKGEVVHHIDGDKLNNSLENLDLCTVQEHNACHGDSEKIVFELYKRGVVGYDRTTKRYYLK
jgi:hypothetical protein